MSLHADTFDASLAAHRKFFLALFAIAAILTVTPLQIVGRAMYVGLLLLSTCFFWSYRAPMGPNAQRALIFFGIYCLMMEFAYLRGALVSGFPLSSRALFGPAITFLVFYNLLAFLTTQVTLLKPRELSAKLLTIAGLFLALMVCWDIVFGVKKGLLGLPILQGFFYNSNAAGTTLAVFTTIAVARLYLYGGYLNAILSVVFSAMLLATFTRSGMLGVFVSAILILLLDRRPSRHFFGIAVVVTGVAFTLVVTYFDTLSFLFTQGGKAFTRSAIWAAAIETLSDSPWLGLSMGYQEFGTTSLAQGLSTVQVDRVGVGVHNTYLHLLLNAGILGFSAYVLCIAPVFIECIRRCLHSSSVHRETAVLLLAVGILCMIRNLFETMPVGSLAFGPLVSGLVLALMIRLLDQDFASGRRAIK